MNVREIEKLIKSTVETQDVNLEKQIETYRTSLEDRLKNLRAMNIDYDDIPHENIVQRILGKKKPFGKKDKGYKDALIWESILKILNYEGDFVIFITYNSADFANKEQTKLHPDLISDLEDKGFDAEAVVISNGMSDFTSKCVEPKLQFMIEIKERLEKDTYLDLLLSELLEEKRDLIESEVVTEVSLYFTGGYVNIHYLELSGKYTVGDVYEIETNKLFIRFETDYYLDVEATVNVSDFNNIIHGLDDYTILGYNDMGDIEISTHHTAPVEVEVIFNEKTKTVESFEIIGVYI